MGFSFSVLLLLLLLFFFFALLGFELSAYTLSHSTSPFCDGFLKIGLGNYLPAGFEP
jgi:hypothetical protein